MFKKNQKMNQFQIFQHAALGWFSIIKLESNPMQHVDITSIV